MSCQDEFLTSAVESEFYIGDEDMDDSPVRFLEIVGFQQSKLRCGAKYFSNRWTSANNAPLLKAISAKINPLKIFSEHKPKPCGDVTVLYGVFRI